jgi:ketosteroid isomerase-like protein
MHSIGANKSLACALIHAASRGSVNEFNQLTAADFTWTITGSGSFQGTMTRAQYAERLSDMDAILDGALTMSITSLTGEEDRVVVEAESNAALKTGGRTTTAICSSCECARGRFQAFENTWTHCTSNGPSGYSQQHSGCQEVVAAGPRIAPTSLVVRNCGVTGAPESVSNGCQHD